MCIFCEDDYPTTTDATNEHIQCNDICGINTASNLHGLSVNDCPNLQRVSSGKILSEIYINNCPMMHTIPSCYDDGDKSFMDRVVIRNCPQSEFALEADTVYKLKLENCPNLIEVPLTKSIRYLCLKTMTGITSMPVIPKLKRLRIAVAPNITSFGGGDIEYINLQSLYQPVDLTRYAGSYELDLYRSPNVTFDLSSVRSLTITDNDIMTTVASMPNLVDLSITDCSACISIEPQLKMDFLDVDNCPNLQSVGHQPELKSLYISKCPKLIDIVLLPNMSWLYVQYCDQAFNIKHMEYITRTLSIYNCPNFILPEPANSRLQELIIINHPNVTRIHSYPMMRSLKVDYCHNLTRIDQMPRGKYIEIVACPQSIILPYGSVYDSVSISSCPRLEIVPLDKHPSHTLDGKAMVTLPKVRATPRMIRLYNSLYVLWKRFKLIRYANYLESTIYSDPEKPYMLDMIESGRYGQEASGSLKVGVVNSNGQLIWFTT